MSDDRLVGLFAGIGGLELGLQHAGLRTSVLCELDDAARAVLKSQFSLSTNRIWRDVRRVRTIPQAHVLAAGFPCQDLSQAGRKSGIGGKQSGLVAEVFRLVNGRSAPTWLLLENVSYMLSLDRGGAMHYLVSSLEDMGYTWAYRVVDARAFGVAQRRQRVLVLASRSEDPRGVLFADESDGPEFDDSIGGVDADAWYGFYWTEGLRGLGWTKNAVPTIKGGSQLGIPSPPAIWQPRSGHVCTPGIEDLEALQGFDRGWTAAASTGPTATRGARYRLVGNAVCTAMSAWIGRRLADPGEPLIGGRELDARRRWPTAAWGAPNKGRYAIELSMRPLDSDFDLRAEVCDLTPLSIRATAGFLDRAGRGNLRFADGFIEALEDHLDAAASRSEELVA